MAIPMHLLPFLLLTVTVPVLAMPPASPINCKQASCALSNSYGAFNDRIQCLVPTILYPTTEEDILSAVAQATRNQLKVKVVSGFSHTIPKLACPNPTDSVLISTAKYNSKIEVDVAKRTVTADSGVGLRDLIDKVEANGLSLVAAPYWEGVSVGGLISSGSHGSSWWGKGGAVHDHVVGVRLVVAAGTTEGFAKVVTVASGDPLFNSARVSLGLLGVISKVTFSLEPAFKRSITYSFQNDALLEDEFIDLARKHEFADITWYPSKHQAVYRLDDRAPLNASGDGVNDFLGFQSTPILATTALRATETGFEKSKNVNGKCKMASVEINYKKLIANGLKNNNLLFTGYPVVGHQGKMQTSGSCLHSPGYDLLSCCAWDPRIKGLFFYESTAIFPASKFRDFITDVKKLRDLKPENFCGVDSYNGFLVRFIKASDAYLGQPEDSVVVDFNYYRANDPSTPRLNEDVWEEVEQMAFFKHGARPHWGKNRKVAFLGVQQKYPNMSKFIAAKKLLDPQGVFSSPWSDEVISGRSLTEADGCALEGECICSEDRHCSPGDGFMCRPGLVYQEARLCRDSDAS